MYYLELIEKFWDFNQKERLSTTSVAMYLYLLKLGNDRGGYDISITDMTLANILSITRKTVRPTKEKLRSLGLLQFENRRGLPCSYRLVLDYPLEISENGKEEKTEIDLKSQNPVIENNLKSKSVSRIPERIEPIGENPQKYSRKVEPPSWEEFLDYARTLEDYNVSLDSNIKEKYCSWSDNDWKNAANRPITNWKSSLKSLLPYMQNDTDNNTLSIESISKIKRPKS